MSFDLRFRRFQRGKANSFMLSAVVAVIRKQIHAPPDRHGRWQVVFEDGSSIDELYLRRGESEATGDSCTIALRSVVTPAMAQFMIEFALAGELTLLPAMKGAMAVIFREQDRKQLPEELYDDAITCDSTVALETLLNHGYAAWTRSRDQKRG